GQSSIVKMPKPAEGTGGKKRSRVPGVMVTQYIEELPPGSTTPDFIRKPIALTIQEGKLAFFKAVVSGYPVPDVSWARNKGDISNSTKYVSRFDEKNEEYILEIPNVDSDQADTYKCFAINPFGKAVCTAALNVIEGRKFIKVGKRKEKQWNEGEIDPRFWEVLLSAPRKDYERICQEFGVTDFRWMLRKLNQKKKEREAEQSKKIHSLKQIEVKTDGTAEFELDMKLKDPNSKILLFKDGEMLDYGDGTDEATKHNMQKFGETYLFSIRDVGSEDAGLYQVDVEEVNMFSTSLILEVTNYYYIKYIKVIEGQDAVFECALSDPVPQITWCANDISVEHGEKYDIAVSEDKQVHKLAVKNCTKEDKGVYTAIAGLRSSQGTLDVEEKFTYSLPVSKTLDFQAAPKFIVPLKVHAAPPGYECYMSCAVTGNPTPHITWYHNNVSLNTNPNYYITNVCGVCSLLILRVGPKDMGEYKVVAESPLGHDECSTKLIVKGISSILILINLFW
uniref:Immunoglobulin-like and fibronectin type III domain-containing protein 1 n=1 Tax=Sinocyclocheilus rhinocerous TaxID=307959 RepID=A0A673GYH4_9TELE